MMKRILSLLLAVGLLLSSASALTAEQTREILQTYYIDEIPEEVLAKSTTEEILAALGDPYTEYYSAEEYAAFQASMEDTQIVGIGVSYYLLPEGMLLSEIAPDSPAQEAGLRPGDYIIMADGHDIRGAAESDVDSWIRGDEGTQVRLTVLRGEETFEVTAARRQVVFPTVTLDKIENGVAWITCQAFGSTTFQHFCDIIAAHDDEVEQWIVDLRGNGGGDVGAAVFSAGCFAGRGEGVYLRDGTGWYYSYLHDPDVVAALGYYEGELPGFYEAGYLTADPVYVLTDGNTASAAEIFCAAVRDSGAGLIVGGRTFGKGVAQTMFSASYPDAYFELGKPEDYFIDGEALKVTTERGFSTRGATYDKVGVLPHFLVPDYLADEVAAILAAPVSQEEDALILRDLSAASQLVDDMILPMSMLCDPENADAVVQLLSALPATASCQLRRDGAITDVTAAQAAEVCGVSLEKRTFADAEGSEFSTQIDTLGVYGIVNGVGDGTFRPEASLDRASLCALLAKAMQYPLSEGGDYFDDVPADAWYAPYVNALYEMGIVNGSGDGLFHPDDPISHEQFLTILGRTAQWLDKDYYEMSRHDGIYGDLLPDGETLAERYPDYADWAREMVWLCDGDLAWDEVAAIDAQTSTTREEAACAMFNLFEMSGVLHS